MDISKFTSEKPGRLVRTAQGYWTFVPSPLPPDLALSWELVGRLSEADRAMSELAGLGQNLPNPHLLIAPFLRREAVLSSRIEGTQASLSDLLFFEAGAASLVEQGAPAGDVQEVANYVRAMEYGLARLKELPLSLRMIRELHAVLMESVRGQDRTSGEFRRAQNWIGPPGCRLDDATFVPPAVHEMRDALDAFERFLHVQSRMPPLIWIALAHYQFESIHPFADGNGRIGRLLIALLLSEKQLMILPLLYLSAFFEQHRNQYYNLLLAVSRSGRWTDWIEFFLQGVAEQSRDAIWRVGRLLSLRHEYRGIVESARASALLPRLVDILFEHPAVTVPMMARRLRVTHRSARLNISKLVDRGILREATRRQRNRVYIAPKILEVVQAERTPLAPHGQAPGGEPPKRPKSVVRLDVKSTRPRQRRKARD